MAVPSAGLHSQQSRKETKRVYRLRWNGQTLFPASAWAALPGRGHIEAAARPSSKVGEVTRLFCAAAANPPPSGARHQLHSQLSQRKADGKYAPSTAANAAPGRGGQEPGLPLFVTFYDSLLRIPGRAAGGGKSASHQDAMLVQRGHYERNGRPASAGEALPLAGPRPADPFASGRAYGPAGREGVRPGGPAAIVFQGRFSCSARPEERIASPPGPGRHPPFTSS